MARCRGRGAPARCIPARSIPARCIPAGFSLVEIVIAVAVIGIMSAAAIPVVSNVLDRGRVSRTQDEAATIAKAIKQFEADLDSWPVRNSADTTTPFTLLRSTGGATPTWTATAWTTTLASQSTLETHLVTNGHGYTARAANGEFGWAGPYMGEFASGDAWGNAYWASVGGFANASGTNGVVWVLSPGVDRAVDTQLNATALADDDLGIRLN